MTLPKANQKTLGPFFWFLIIPCLVHPLHHPSLSCCGGSGGWQVVMWWWQQLAGCDVAARGDVAAVAAGKSQCGRVAASSIPHLVFASKRGGDCGGDRLSLLLIPFCSLKFFAQLITQEGMTQFLSTKTCILEF